MIVLRVVCLADGSPTIHDGQYLVYSNRHSGLVAGLWTSPSIEEAKTFPSVAEALEYWQQISPTVPVRPDGKPNRPLTAYTMETVHAPEEEG